MSDFHLVDQRIGFYRAFVQKVINGDTLIVLVDMGLHETRTARLRLHGVDAPEVEPRVGNYAQRMAERQLGGAARDRLVDLVESREIVAKIYETPKIGKYTADIYLAGQIVSVNEMLLAEGLGVKFGDRPPWR